MDRRKLKIIYRIMFLGAVALTLVDNSLFAVRKKTEQQPSVSIGGDDEQQGNQPIFLGGMGNLTDPAVARIMGRITGLKAINAEIKRLQSEHDKSTDSEVKDELHAQIVGLGRQRTRIIDILGQLDHPFGRAVFVGLAGNDAKALQDVPIQGIPEGICLGMFVRFSSACSDVLEPRIKSAADNIVGGSWDFFANHLGNMWNSVFHGGKKAFSVKNLSGWQELVKTCFLDIERLLRDGLKDSLRGQDMTLRDPEDATAEPIKINAWQFLVEGYARQFDYIVTQLDKHLTYYSEEEDDVMVFYAQEIKRRLLETKSFLLTCKSVKELDAFLESSKGLIPALNKNIEHLFKRLIDLIASQVSQTKPTNTYTPSRTTYGGQRDTMTNSGIGDDADYPHSMRGW